jgi:hypothetical protein
MPLPLVQESEHGVHQCPDGAAESVPETRDALSLSLIDLREVTLRTDPAFGQAPPRPAWYCRFAFPLTAAAVQVLICLAMFVIR